MKTRRRKLGEEATILQEQIWTTLYYCLMAGAVADQWQHREQVHVLQQLCSSCSYTEPDS